MYIKILSSVLLLTASMLLIGCGTKENTVAPSSNNETTVDSKKDTKEASNEPVVPSKSEDEIKEMVKKASKDKVLKYHIQSGYYNDDKTLDFFVTTNHLSPAEASYSNYFFYDSEADKLKRLTIKKSSKHFNSLEINAIEKGELQGTAILLFETNDLGTFRKKTDVIFTIEGSVIVFDDESLSNIKKTESKLTKEVGKELQKLESEFPDL